MVQLDEDMEIGYMPNPKFLMHDVDEDQKKHALSHHSENLAIEFWLINTSHGCLFKLFHICANFHSYFQGWTLYLWRLFMMLGR